MKDTLTRRGKLIAMHPAKWKAINEAAHDARMSETKYIISMLDLVVPGMAAAVEAPLPPTKEPPQ